MKNVVYRKLMALSLALIPIMMLGGCQKETTVAENAENNSIFESMSQDENAESNESSEDASEGVDNVSTPESSTESSEESSTPEAPTENNDEESTADTPTGTDQSSPTSRKDGERFEETIMLEGMEETVNYEHAVSESLGFEIDYDYESLIRKSDSEKESFISMYDDPEHPDNYLEVTFISENADAALTSIKDELSNSYDIEEETCTLSNAGDCFRIDAFAEKDSSNTSGRLQRVYVIPAGEGSLVATSHFTIESAEGFGGRFDDLIDTIVVTGGDSTKKEN